MKYIIWTSWFFYRDWVGTFYPKNLKKSEWLDYYSQFFNWLEINSSFYHFPNKNSIYNYKKYNLTYIFKANKIFSHLKKYNQDQIKQFLSILSPLWDKLNWILFQFPPNFTLNENNLSYLKNLIKIFLSENQIINYFVEFRHPDWFKDIDLLKDLVNKFNWKLIIVHTDWIFRSNLINWPFKNININFEYFRFHWRWEKTYNYTYTDQELQTFAEKIKILSKNKEKVFIFFNNTVKAQAIQNAITLKNLLTKY